MTQTPASGPLLLVTTPPMSSGSIWTAFCRAPTTCIDIAAAATARYAAGYKILLVIRSPDAFRAGGLRPAGPPGSVARGSSTFRKSVGHPNTEFSPLLQRRQELEQVGNLLRREIRQQSFRH